MDEKRREVTVCDGYRLDGHQPATWPTFHQANVCPAWCAAAYPYDERPPVPNAARANTVDARRVQVGDKGVHVVVAPHDPVVQAAAASSAPHTASLAAHAPAYAGSEGEAYDKALDGIRALLSLMGEDPTRPGLLDTPARVIKAYLELADAPGDPEALLGKVFRDVDTIDSEMIAVPGIAFVSLCEHHLLPFTGTATVAYIPNAGGVVGLSKIPRLVQHFARRPQVQERLTGQIVNTMVDHLRPLGAAVLIESSHACMALRGVRAQEATMVTSALRGRFLENDATRAEFMALATRG